MDGSDWKRCILIHHLESLKRQVWIYKKLLWEDNWVLNNGKQLLMLQISTSKLNVRKKWQKNFKCIFILGISTPLNFKLIIRLELKHFLIYRKVRNAYSVSISQGITGCHGSNKMKENIPKQKDLYPVRRGEAGEEGSLFQRFFGIKQT